MLVKANRNPIYMALLIGSLILLGCVPSAKAETVNYTYDDLNRLIKVEYEYGTVIQYTYDAAGNRLSYKASPLSEGTLTVVLSPAKAVSAGARWRVDGGAWRISGGTATGLSVGNHKVDFKPVTGWTTPVGKTVLIKNGETTRTKGAYVQQKGSLAVSISPSAAINAGARWKVDAQAWKNSGQTVTGLAVGKHTVSFKKITGWKAPVNLTVTIRKNTTSRVGGKYVRSTASREEDASRSGDTAE